jgi:ABC-type multidrug transport system ATPase subunit
MTTTRIGDIGKAPERSHRRNDKGRDDSYVSTHTLAVAEEMCDRIGIMHGGRLIALGTVSELRQKVGGKEINLEAVFLRLTADC